MNTFGGPVANSKKNCVSALLGRVDYQKNREKYCVSYIRACRLLEKSQKKFQVFKYGVSAIFKQLSISVQVFILRPLFKKFTSSFKTLCNSTVVLQSSDLKSILVTNTPKEFYETMKGRSFLQYYSLTPFLCRITEKKGYYYQMARRVFY